MTGFPNFVDTANSRATLTALQSYARVLGAYRSLLAPRQKHWWHIGLLPGDDGFGTGRLSYGEHTLELRIDCQSSFLAVDIDDRSSPIQLSGQSAVEIHRQIASRLQQQNVSVDIDGSGFDASKAATYDAASARTIGNIFHNVAGLFASWRGRTRHETGPVLLWPHHFDLAVLMLTGRQVPGVDHSDDEKADEQINFGFLFGDASINEPYFYVTYYPLPPALDNSAWPAPIEWYSGDFFAAIARYRHVVQDPDPAGRLVSFWDTALTRGLDAMNLEKETP